MATSTGFRQDELLTAEEWQVRTRAAISWLRRSFAATGYQGSAHSWHPVLGWNKAYPETTGYIIPTLLDYAVLHHDNSLRDLAVQAANWLTTIQLPGGAFAGLLAGHTQPSVFNTSQILFGLTRIVQEHRANKPVQQALERAVTWLVDVLEQDGSWRQHSFVPGFTPAYYTRAVWAVLYANQVLGSTMVEDKMRAAIGFYSKSFLTENEVGNWGFKPGKPAFTHTIAYTLEGFWESALQLGDAHLLRDIQLIAGKLLTVRASSNNQTAGAYQNNWQGDYSFLCLTGNAQLSVFYHRLFEKTGDLRYRIASQDFLREILPHQCLHGSANRYGAMAGSAPFWDKYLPFRYPNWAAKFFLDAMWFRV